MPPSRTGFDHASRPAPHAMAHKALAHPRRQCGGTAPTAPAHRPHAGGVAGARLGLLVCGQWSIQRRHRATLMRHEVDDAAAGDGGGGLVRCAPALTPVLAPATRARRVRHAPGAAALVAPGRFTLRFLARRARAGPPAIALAAIAAAAQQHLRAATRAHEQAGRMVSRQLPGSSGNLPRTTARGHCQRIALDDLVRQCDTGGASASPRGVGYGDAVATAATPMAARRARLYSGHARSSTSSIRRWFHDQRAGRTHPPQIPPRSRPPCRAACCANFNQNDQRESAVSPPFSKNRHFAAGRQKRRITAE
jgi:hypothetical protein